MKECDLTRPLLDVVGGLGMFIYIYIYIRIVCVWFVCLQNDVFVGGGKMWTTEHLSCAFVTSPSISMMLFRSLSSPA